MALPKLQDRPIIIPPNAVEIEKAVESIRSMLESNLTWIDKAYFIAQKFHKLEKGRSYYYPETYAPEKPKSRNYTRLTPDNDYKGMFFFLVGEGDINFEPNQYNFITYPVSIIFSVNLDLIDEARLNTGIFTQSLISEARRLITDKMIMFDFDYTMESEKRGLEDVYREFSMKDIEKYNRAPQQCFRFDMNVRIQEECT